ncbi:MAG: HPP family protein [Bacteriovoracia bacterium]
MNTAEILNIGTTPTLAKDVMSTELITVRDDCSLEEALKVLINNRITGLPVVDKQGKLVGVLSEYDILAQVAQAGPLKPQHFEGKITFSNQVDSIAQDTPIDEVIEHFVKSRFRRLPVVDGKGKQDKLVGIITRRDLIRLFYYRAQLS